LNYNQLSETEIALLNNYKPSLIYGRAKPEAPDNFVPSRVANDKKVNLTNTQLFVSYYL